MCIWILCIVLLFYVNIPGRKLSLISCGCTWTGFFVLSDPDSGLFAIFSKWLDGLIIFCCEQPFSLSFSSVSHRTASGSPVFVKFCFRKTTNQYTNFYISVVFCARPLAYKVVCNLSLKWLCPMWIRMAS